MNANFNLLNENRKAHWKNICVSSKAQWLSQKKKKKNLNSYNNYNWKEGREFKYKNSYGVKTIK